MYKCMINYASEWLSHASCMYIGPTGHSQSCEANQFLCQIDHHCKNNSLKCNGIRDCLDGSDEMNCGENVQRYVMVL